MMPTILRRSGPDIERNGKMVTPRAMVSTCEDCGGSAPFGITAGGKFLTYCSWRDGEPVCASVKTQQPRLL